MTGDELSALVDERLRLVEQLMELTQRQVAAIAAGHMSELMTILAAKQSPLTRLSQLSKQLSAQVGAQVPPRTWASQADRQRCRETHRRCEQKLLDLIAQEKACEQDLSAGKALIQQELDRTHDTGRALRSYASVSA